MYPYVSYPDSEGCIASSHGFSVCSHISTTLPRPVYVGHFVCAIIAASVIYKEYLMPPILEAVLSPAWSV